MSTMVTLNAIRAAVKRGDGFRVKGQKVAQIFPEQYRERLDQGLIWIPLVLQGEAYGKFIEAEDIRIIDKDMIEKMRSEYFGDELLLRNCYNCVNFCDRFEGKIAWESCRIYADLRFGDNKVLDPIATAEKCEDFINEHFI